MYNYIKCCQNIKLPIDEIVIINWNIITFAEVMIGWHREEQPADDCQ